MYAVIDKKTNRVIKVVSEELKGLSEYVFEVEVASLPKVGKDEYLTYENNEFKVNTYTYTKEQLLSKYENLVEILIRKKYSLSNELSLLRQRDSKIDEFNAYNAYVEESKRMAKEKIYR